MNAIVHTEAMTETQRASLAHTLATLNEVTTRPNEGNEGDNS